MSTGNGKEQDTRRRRASTGRRMEAIMELARGLPLTRQVLADSLEEATEYLLVSRPLLLPKKADRAF